MTIGINNNSYVQNYQNLNGGVQNTNYTNSYSTNSIFANNNTTQVQNTDSFENSQNCTDGADDGKISFGEKAGSFIKGIFSPITNMFKSPGNFLKGAAMIAGGAILCAATGGAAAPLLVAAGVGMGGFQAVKGIVNASSATTDAEAKAAWEDIGGGTSAVAMSVIGAKAAAKGAASAGVEGFEGAESMNMLQATKACITNAGKAGSASLKAFTSGAWKTNLGLVKGGSKSADTAKTESAKPAETPKEAEVKVETKPTESKAPEASSAGNESGDVAEIRAEMDKSINEIKKTVDEAQDIANRIKGKTSSAATEVNTSAEEAPVTLEEFEQAAARETKLTTVDEFKNNGGRFEKGVAIGKNDNPYNGIIRKNHSNGDVTEIVYEKGEAICSMKFDGKDFKLKSTKSSLYDSKTGIRTTAKAYTKHPDYMYVRETSYDQSGNLTIKTNKVSTENLETLGTNSETYAIGKQQAAQSQTKAASGTKQPYETPTLQKKYGVGITAERIDTNQAALNNLDPKILEKLPNSFKEDVIIYSENPENISILKEFTPKQIDRITNSADANLFRKAVSYGDQEMLNQIKQTYCS